MRFVMRFAAVMVVLSAGGVPGAARAQVHTLSQTQQIAAFKTIEKATSTEVRELDAVLRTKGYRLESLAVSSDKSANGPRYAAIWLQSQGPGRKVVMDLSLAEYDSLRVRLAPAAYRPTVITASGAGSDAVYAVVLEDAPAGADDYMAYADLTMEEFYAAWDTALEKDLMLGSYDLHGTTDDERVSAVFWPNPSHVDWQTVASPTRVVDGHQFTYWTQARGYHPVDVALHPYGYYPYNTVWVAGRDDDWYQESGMSVIEYQRRISEKRAEGFRPISVDSEAGEYGAVWRR